MGEVLRVSLDVSAVPPRPAGAGRYIVELALGLSARPEIDLVLLCRRGDALRWQALVAGSGSSVVEALPASRPLRLLAERWLLGRRLRRLHVDLHHGPHYTMPAARAIPVVVSIMDPTFFDHPELHERSKVVVFRRAITRSAREADRLIAISDFTARRLREVVEVRAPISVVHLGVDHERFRPVAEDPAREVAARSSLELEGVRYLLFVSTLEPRKGLVELLTAFDRLAGEDPTLWLVLVGQDGWHGEHLEAAFARLVHGDRVRRLGYVPDDVLPVLLRGAVAVAYPSRVEGFGLPALEALACGAPLVTTAGTVMAELVGDAALLVPPGDARELERALEDLLAASATSRATRRERGIAVAAGFTWQACVEGHVQAYQAAHAARRRHSGTG